MTAPRSINTGEPVPAALPVMAGIVAVGVAVALALLALFAVAPDIDAPRTDCAEDERLTHSPAGWTCVHIDQLPNR